MDEQPLDDRGGRIPFGHHRDQQLESERSEWRIDLAFSRHSVWHAVRLVAESEVLEL